MGVEDILILLVVSFLMLVSIVVVLVFLVLIFVVWYCFGFFGEEVGVIYLRFGVVEF